MRPHPPLPRPHAPLSGPIGGKTSGRSATLLEGLPHPFQNWGRSSERPSPGGRGLSEEVKGSSEDLPESVADLGGTNILGVRLLQLSGYLI